MGRPGAGNPGQILGWGKHISIEQCARRLHAPVEIYCGKHGLEGVDEEPLFEATSGGFLAAAELKIAAEVELVGGGKQVIRAHQVILEKRQLAFVKLAETGEQPLTYEPAKDGITEELKAFVIRGGLERG